MLYISNNVTIRDNEIKLNPVRSRGSGGQNVNKVATAIHLRFDIKNSSLPDFYKNRLLNLKDQRVNKDGVIIIKSQQYRNQVKNRQAALSRLQKLVRSVSTNRKQRIPTKIPRAINLERLERKRKRSQTKSLRKKLTLD